MSCRRALGLALAITTLLAAGCGTPAPPIVTTPQYPGYIFPALASPDPRQEPLMRQHEAAWRWLQGGDLARAEQGFQEVLKRSPAFYPSEAALGYVQLASRSYAAALERFDAALIAQPQYVSALVGRGEALLGQSRDADALSAFEAAVKADPTLAEMARRVEVLRARAAQATVAAARQAAQANRLDEAAALYEKAIAASPQSAFLVRDLADIEVKQGKTDQALARYRRVVELDPTDAASRIRAGEILDARGDLEGAMKLYGEANDLEPSAEVRRRISALEARLAYLRLPAEYRAIPESTTISRGDLAALIGLRLAPQLESAPVRAVVITDARNHWAAMWIMATATAGVMEPYENHTFQPGSEIRRSDLAQAVSRLLKIATVDRPAMLKDWQSRQQKMADVGVSNVRYADVSLAVAAGILALNDRGMFELSRPVTGAEAIDAISRIERLNTSTR